jgi:hypothetical protein
VSVNLFAQDTYRKYATKFYSRIDSSRRLQCCDSGYNGIYIVCEIPLLEFPYSGLDIKDYEERHSDDGYVDSYVDDLVDAYNKIKPSLRSKITKSCYSMSVDYRINQDLTFSGLYWIEGSLRVKFSFQSEDKDFALPWYKKLFRRAKR